MLVAVLTGAAAALQEGEVPSRSFWEDGWPHLAITVVSVLSLLLSAVLVEEYRRLRLRRDSDNRLHDLARSVARNVAESLPIDIDDISVHVWRVRSVRKMLPFRPRLAYLERQAAFIPERREHEEFAWLLGRGVVGRCWQRRREVIVDLDEEIYAHATDAATFYSLSYENRLRMTFAQVRNTRHFKAVWAYPLFVGPVAAPSFAGCVSVDVRISGRAAALRYLADHRSHDLNSLLADCAAALRAEG